MRRYLCTNCWRILAEESAFIECPECKSSAKIQHLLHWMPKDKLNGQQRTRVRDVLASRYYLHNIFKKIYNSAPHLQCPLHPNTAQKLFCECDKLLLPSSIINSEDERISIRMVGNRGAGKTVLLSAMCASLRRKDSPMHLLGIGDTDLRFHAIEDTLINKCTQPSPTHPGNNLGYAWNIVLRDRVRINYSLLVMHDVAGETWINLPETPPEILDRYLRYPGDLLFVIDGARLAADLKLTPLGDAWEPAKFGDGGAADRAILSNIRNYDRNQIDKMRLALVITKADLLTELHGDYPSLNCNMNQLESVADEDLRDLLKITGRGALVTLGEQFQGNSDGCKVFATSSLGFRPTADDINFDKTLKRCPRPCHVDAPLRWLLDIDP